MFSIILAACFLLKLVKSSRYDAPNDSSLFIENCKRILIIKTLKSIGSSHRYSCKLYSNVLFAVFLLYSLKMQNKTLKMQIVSSHGVTADTIPSNIKKSSRNTPRSKWRSKP